jgi:folate-binding protein YgfZ
MPLAETSLEVEYAAAREGSAFVTLDRAVLAATGPQRQKFLHSILSNAIEGLSAGQGCLAALMDAKGHLIALMRVLVGADAVLLELPAARLVRVRDALLFYKVAAPVRFEARPAAVIAVVGPVARACIERLTGAAVPELPPFGHVELSVAAQPARLVRAEDLPASAFVLHIAPEHLPDVASALTAAGARPIKHETLDVLRVEDGRPLYGVDVTEENLLHETGLLPEYHSPAKGCYIGQEVVARLEARGGNVNKRLCGLRLTEPASAGAIVRSEGRDVGRVTTAGVSPRLGPIALAYLHRSAFEAGHELSVDGKRAVVSALPFGAEAAR